MVGEVLLHGRRPREVGELVHELRCLEPGRLEGLSPDTSEVVARLEYEGIEPLGEDVLAGEEAAYPCTDNGDLLLPHCLKLLHR